DLLSLSSLLFSYLSSFRSSPSIRSGRRVWKDSSAGFVFVAPKLRPLRRLLLPLPSLHRSLIRSRFPPLQSLSLLLQSRKRHRPLLNPNRRRSFRRSQRKLLDQGRVRERQVKRQSRRKQADRRRNDRNRSLRYTVTGRTTNDFFEVVNRSKEQVRSKQQVRSKETPKKGLRKEKANNKRSRTSSAEKINRKSVSTPERSTQPTPIVAQRNCATEMSEAANEKTTEVDPNKTLASEAEKRTERTENSVVEKKQSGVKKAAPTKERTSMRRRMKDAALASSRQIRRASNSLTDSAKKLANVVSRPIKERSLNNFMERVKQRQERRLKQNSESMQLRESEDAFPTMQGVSADNLVDPPGPPTERSEKTTERSEKSERDKRKIGNKDVDKIFPDLGKEKKKKSRSASGSKASKRAFLSGRRRKSKEGDLFKDGKPYWVRAGKITQEEKNEITQDDLPLNAEVIVDVKNGKIDLPVLPNNMQIKFDEYAPMEILMERDKIFFTHKMLFANTIRSMINTADESKTDTDTNNNTDIERTEKTVEKKTECDEGSGRPRIELMPHPKYCTSYNRALPTGKMHREPYEWTGKGVV
ncbi:hypothetical protein PRIPAC_73376, partial [Pristionchus pacificus]